MSTIPGSRHYWSSVLNSLRDENQRSWILINPTSIGDTWIVCALARAFKEQHGGPLIMVVKPGQAPLAQMYMQHIDKIIMIDDLLGVAGRVERYATFDRDMPIIAHPYWNGDGRLDLLNQLYAYPGRGGITLSDCMRYVLHLDWSATTDLPTIHGVWRQAAETYAAQLGMVRGESVILLPDNNSNTPLPNEFWQSLADKLCAEGKMVFTNLAGNAYQGQRQEPFKNTHAISLTLDQAIPLVEYAGRAISGCNGMYAMLGASQIAADVTGLIYMPPKPGYEVNGLKISAPIPYQSIRYFGEPYGDRVKEYLVNPDTFNDDVVSEIARSGDGYRCIFE